MKEPSEEAKRRQIALNAPLEVLNLIEPLLLDRLKAAEAVCKASEAHIRYAWSGDESRVGLVSFGAYRGKNEAANSEFARTDKIDETQAAAIAALVAWRKLTGAPE